MTQIETLNDIIAKNFLFNQETLKQFLTLEYCFFSNQTSFNLTKIDPKKEIYFYYLENYFQYPKIFSQSIFNALDKSKKGFLNYEDYLNGFLTILNGNLEDRIYFIFKMFEIKENKIFLNDIKIILNFTAIYFNLNNFEKINFFIEDFFGNKSYLNFNSFQKKIINENNNGLFLFILSIIFKFNNFSNEMNLILKEQNEKKISNNNLEKSFSYNTNSNVISRKNSKFKKKNKKNEIYDFIKNNFNIEIAQTSNINSNFIYSHSSSKNFYTMSTINSLYQNGSAPNEKENFSEDEEDLIDLQLFEFDYKLLKINFNLTVGNIKKFNIPKGSNDFILINGVFHSNNIHKYKSSKKLLKYKEIEGEKTPKITIERTNTNFSNYSNATFSDFKSINNNNNSYFLNEIIEEEVFLFNDSTFKIKSYNLFITKNHLILIKKNQNVNNDNNNKNNDNNNKNNDNNNNDNNNKNNDNNNDNDNNDNNNNDNNENNDDNDDNDTINDNNIPNKVKIFIPLKNLYIFNNNDIETHNEKIYICLYLVSTLYFTKRKFKFLCESKSQINNITNSIIKKTNYSTINEEYTFVKSIGNGSFCQMNLMKSNKSGQLFAVKKISKSCKFKEEFESINWERDIAKFLINYQCKNVINFFKIIETIEHIYFIQEYIESGSLGQFIRKSKTCLPSKTVKEISMQIIEGIYEIHKFGILHRDLKLENILIDDKDSNNLKLKLIDFGLSKVVLENKNTNECYGTFLYSAPEVLLNIPYNLNIDLWSLGIIIFYLQYTYLPFNIIGKEHEQEIASKIVLNELVFPKKIIAFKDSNEQFCNVLLQKIIEKCLVKNSKKRTNIQQIKNFILNEEKIFLNENLKIND